MSGSEPIDASGAKPATTPQPPPRPLVDADDRRRALTTFDQNLLVTAGAGTGKTALLVGRLAAAMVKRHMEPHQVLALTFTENAATEMRERLLRLLRNAQAFVDGGEIADGSDRHTLEDLRVGAEEMPRIRELLERAEELQVQTFHGYCLRLLQQRARELGLPPSIGLLDDDHRARRFDEAFSRFLRAVDDDPPHPALLKFEPDALRRLADGLSRGIPPEALDESRLGLDEDRVAGIERDLADIRRDADGARKQFFAYVEKVEDACRALRRGETPRPIQGSTPVAGKVEVGELLSQELRSRLAAAVAALKPWMEGDDDAVADAIAFLRPFLDAWRRDSLQGGAMSFDDLIVHTRHVLRTNRALREDIGKRLLTILVDEFQDTDPLQYDIVFLLGAEPAAGVDVPDDPLTVPLRPCLFLVGDAKQSIYRFRRADLAAFGRVQQLILDAGGAALSLEANFRSTPSVLDFVNEVGARTIVAEPPFQAEFAAVVPYRPDEELRREVEIWHPAPPQDEDPGPAPRTDARREREARWAIEWIRRQRDDGVPLGGQAILLRAVSDLGWLLRPLRRAGIRYVLQGSRRFYQRHEIQLATALVVAVARPWDPAAVLGVLRSAFVGASDEAIHRYLRGDGSAGSEQQARRVLDPTRLVSDSPEDDAATARQGVVEQGLRWLHGLIDSVAHLDVGSALDLLLSLPEWPVVEGMNYEGPQCLANLERLRSQLGRARPRDLVEAASLLERRVLSEVDSEESPLYDAGETDIDAVTIMSVHASKGLEFDAVLVPECARPTRGGGEIGSGSASRLFLGDGRVVLAARIDKSTNAAAVRVNEDSARHSTAEEMRLLYVAATRARRRLTLLFTEDGEARAKSWQAALEDAGIRPPAEGAPPPPGPWTFRAMRSEPDGTTPEIPRSQDGAEIVQSYLRAADEHRQRLRASTPGDGAMHSTDAVLRPRPRTGGAATLGSELHEYLRLVDPRKAAVEVELLRACARGIGGREPTRELRQLADAFHDSELRTLMATARRIHRETPVSWIDHDGEPQHGVVDLLLQDADGAWRLVDYKTDLISDGGSGDETADDPGDRPDPAERMAEDRHGEQLRRYARGVRTALGLESPPRTSVWFARSDELVDVTTPLPRPHAGG